MYSTLRIHSRKSATTCSANYAALEVAAELCNHISPAWSGGNKATTGRQGRMLLYALRLDSYSRMERRNMSSLS